MKNRGGLTTVNAEGQQLFLAVENKFRFIFETKSMDLVKSRTLLRILLFSAIFDCFSIHLISKHVMK